MGRGRRGVVVQSNHSKINSRLVLRKNQANIALTGEKKITRSDIFPSDFIETLKMNPKLMQEPCKIDETSFSDMLVAFHLAVFILNDLATTPVADPVSRC